MTASVCIYYFYFVDEDLGLCHVRVPTWAAAVPVAESASMAITGWQASWEQAGHRLSNGLDNAFSFTLRTGNRRSASPTDGKQNESMRRLDESSRGGAARIYRDFAFTWIPLERGPVRIRH